MPLPALFLFPAIVIGGVGMSGELSNTPTYAECLSVGPAYACEAEHGNGFVGGEFDQPGRSVPDVPDRPDVPDVPDKDQCNDGKNKDRDDKADKGKGHDKGKGKGHDKGKGKGHK